MSFVLIMKEKYQSPFYPRELYMTLIMQYERLPCKKLEERIAVYKDVIEKEFYGLKND